MLVRGDADNRLGHGWFWIPPDDFVKSFARRAEAVEFLVPLLERRCPEFFVEEPRHDARPG